MPTLYRLSRLVIPRRAPSADPCLTQRGHGRCRADPSHDRQTAGAESNPSRPWWTLYPSVAVHLRARMVEQCLIDGVLGKAPAGFDREVKGGRVNACCCHSLRIWFGPSTLPPNTVGSSFKSHSSSRRTMAGRSGISGKITPSLSEPLDATPTTRSRCTKRHTRRESSVKQTSIEKSCNRCGTPLKRTF